MKPKLKALLCTAVIFALTLTALTTGAAPFGLRRLAGEFRDLLVNSGQPVGDLLTPGL